MRGKEKKVSWKVLLVLYFLAWFLGVLTCLFSRYKLQNTLTKRDWIITIVVLLIGSISISMKAIIDSRKNKRNKDE